jgi:hypothetical protein
MCGVFVGKAFMPSVCYGTDKSVPYGVEEDNIEAAATV